jgi:hypothetical protein
MDSTTYGEILQDHSAAPQLCPDVLNTENYTYCHTAKTVAGWDANSERWIVVGVTCKRWGCPYCAIRKIRRLAWLSKNARPNKLLTLTVSSKRYPDPKNAWTHSSKMFAEWIRWARRTTGPTDYLRVLELQDNGMPHYHCMLRSAYIPHRPALLEWRRLIGEPDSYQSDEPAPKAWAGVNLKAIDDSFRTFYYLVKYLTKLHKLPWTDRHVSYSNQFFNPEDTEEIEYAKLDSIQKYDQHPWVWLNERYGWDTVQVIGEARWLLPDFPNDPQTEIDPAALGLAAPVAATAPLPIRQRLVPGLLDTDRVNEDDQLRPDGTRRKRTAKRPSNTPIPF